MTNNKFKIDKYLTTHGSILKAITSYNLKDVLTIEQDNFFYWVRQYSFGRELQNYGYFENLQDALNKFNEIKSELIKYGVNLKFNEVAA